VDEIVGSSVYNGCSAAHKLTIDRAMIVRTARGHAQLRLYGNDEFMA